jgi:hypothetical protein
MKNPFTSILLMASFALSSGAVLAADGASVAERIAGTWSLMSLEVQQGDNRIAVFGTDPRGIQIMAPNGRFAVITTRAELPLHASGNRMQGTDEEYRAIAQGANAAYGRYTIDEAAGTITFHVEVSTFPNWEGQNQVRAFTLEGDEWHYLNPSPAVGDGMVHVVWRRLD